MIFSSLSIFECISKMKIAIDARPLSHPLTGIGRYTYNVLTCLFKLAPEHTWYLYTDRPLVSEVPTLPNIRIRTGNVGSNFISPLFAQVFFSKWARKDNIDTFWSPRHHLPLFLPRKVKKVVTIHDIVWCQHPETMTTSGKWLERLLMPPSLAIADRILSVSDFTKSELTSALAVNSNKITVTPLAPTPPTHINAPLPSILYQQTFFLFVGTLEPRKNLRNLLKAFAYYSSNNPKQILVIAGKDGWGNDSISKIASELNIIDKINVLGYVSEDTLHALYQNCSALLMPSVYEGFGLPAIEALYYSKPVIATSKSAISPALSPLVININDHSEQEILKAMKILNANKGNELTHNHHIQNTWEQCAEKTLNVLTNSK
jgi:glycosyltransferase involved in cell wall biosynthesis